eukprot:8421891-Heterocapsa_arctica.AAC.1
MEVNKADNVGSVKLRIHMQEGIEINTQRLNYAGRQLSDNRTVGHYGIEHNATLDLSLRLHAGANETDDQRPVVFQED